jgi:hypothetical protein
MSGIKASVQKAVLMHGDRCTQKNAVLLHHPKSDGKAMIGIARARTGIVGFYRRIAGNK